MSCAFRRWWWVVGAWSLVLAVMLGTAAYGQVAQKGNSAQIKQQFNQNKAKLFEAMQNTDKKKTFPNDVLDTAAQYYIFRVTWPEMDVKADAGKTDPIVLALRDFNDHITKQVLTYSKNDQAFLNAYSPVLVARFRELTDMNVVDNARALSYGLQMLPTLAKLQHDSISDYLVELIDPEKGKHDVIKLWAIRALREFPPVNAWGEPFNPPDLQNKPKMAEKAGNLKRIDALTRFILRPAPATSSPEELDAYRYLRREALETLGTTGVPAVTAVAKIGTVEGPVAPLLVRALAPGGLVPETNLHERNEAALALCGLNVKALNKYDPAPTYYFLGQTLAELAQDYNNDLPNIIKPESERRPTNFPWKHTIKRWEQAAAKLVKSTEKDKRAVDLEAKAKSFAKLMMSSTVINAKDIAETAALSKAPPADFLLFQPTVKSTTISWKKGR